MDIMSLHPNTELRLFEAARVSLALSGILLAKLQQEILPRLPSEHEPGIRDALAAIERKEIFSEGFLAQLRDLVSTVGAAIDAETTEVVVEEKGYVVRPGKPVPTRIERRVSPDGQRLAEAAQDLEGLLHHVSDAMTIAAAVRASRRLLEA